MSLLLLLLIAAPEASLHGHSRTFVMVGARPYYSIGEGRLVERRFAPILQQIFFDAAPGVEGVSVVLDAWLTLDAGEQMLANRAIADVDQAWVRWKHRELTLTAGRFFNPTITGRGIRVDGGRILIHPSASIGGIDLIVDAWGGVPVTPSFGDEPLRDVAPVFARDPLDLAPNGADWERPGDWAVGGSLSLAIGRWAEVAAGWARIQDLAEVSRESLTASLITEPTSWLGASAFASWSLYASALEEAELSIYAWPFRSARVALIGGYSDPSLLLPGTSILSVFGGSTHRQIGIEADWFIVRRIRLSGSAEVRETEGVEGERGRGFRTSAAIRGKLFGSTGLLSWELLDDGLYGGYHHARIGVEVPIADWIGIGADGGLFVITGEDPQVALRGGLAARFSLGAFRAVLGGRATSLERGSTELAILGRLEWNGAVSF